MAAGRKSNEKIEGFFFPYPIATLKNIRVKFRQLHQKVTLKNRKNGFSLPAVEFVFPELTRKFNEICYTQDHWEWNNELQKIYLELFNALVKSVVINRIDPTKDIFLQTDASDIV